MRRLLLTLVMSLLLPTSFADAAPKKAKPKLKKKAPTAEQVEPAESDVKEGGAEAMGGDLTSQAVRGTKKFGGGVLVTPLSDFMLQYGLTGYYMLKPDLHLGFDVLMGSKDITGDFEKLGTVQVTECVLSGMAAFGYGRYFFGNSFNVMGGLGLRTASASIRIEADSGEFFESSMDISSVVLPLAVGNHWSWPGGFTIGVDWIAYMVALSGSAKTDSSTNIDDPGIEVLFDDFQSVGDDLAKQSSLTLALTTIGWQF